MRTCEEYELLISAFLDGTLSENERVELAEHLAACPECQQYFDDLAAIHDAFDREEAPVPEDFAENVMARVRETPQDGTNQVIRFPRWQRWAALAACCAIAALGLWGARMWTTGPGAANQTATANDAPVMARSVESDYAGDGAEYGAEATMDEIPIGLDLGAPEEDLQKAAEYQKTTDSPADGEPTGGAVKPPVWPETAADYERDAAPAAAYEEELAMEAAAPAPTAGGSPEVLCGVITAGGPAAQAWVEEALGQEWEIGRAYPLTEEEYAGLLDALTAAGETFQQEFGERFQLLAAPPGR